MSIPRFLIIMDKLIQNDKILTQLLSVLHPANTHQ